MRNKTDNIILIGMPGSGKSTIGVVLAKKLGYHFVDSDIVIQEQYGKTLSELIAEYQDAGFLEIENKVNQGINGHHTVIATGGSVVYGAEAMQHFQEIGCVIYLDVPREELEERLGSLEERGVVSNGKTDVSEIFADRKRLYEKYADITVHQDGMRLRETVEQIAAIIYNESIHA